MIEDIERVLLSEEQIHGIVSRLGRQISEDYKDKKRLMVSVLKGSFVFMADLMLSLIHILSIPAPAPMPCARDCVFPASMRGRSARPLNPSYLF